MKHVIQRICLYKTCRLSCEGRGLKLHVEDAVVCAEQGRLSCEGRGLKHAVASSGVELIFVASHARGVD